MNKMRFILSLKKADYISGIRNVDGQHWKFNSNEDKMAGCIANILLKVFKWMCEQINKRSEKNG